MHVASVVGSSFTPKANLPRPSNEAYNALTLLAIALLRHVDARGSHYKLWSRLSTYIRYGRVGDSCHDNRMRYRSARGLNTISLSNFLATPSNMSMWLLPVEMVYLALHGEPSTDNANRKMFLKHLDSGINEFV